MTVHTVAIHSTVLNGSDEPVLIELVPLFPLPVLVEPDSIADLVIAEDFWWWSLRRALLQAL